MSEVKAEAPMRRSSRNTTAKRYDTDLGGSEGSDNDLDEESGKRRGRPRKGSLTVVPGGGTPPVGPPGSSGRPKLETGDKKRGRPSKEIQWDDNYTGPLRRCAYIGHEDLWGPDVPVDLQPQYFYSTTARCIYCYKHLCNERHANKTRDKAAGTTTTSSKKKGRGRRGDDEEELDDEDDGTPTGRRRSGSRGKRARDDEWGSAGGPRAGGRVGGPSRPVGPSVPPAPNILQNAEMAQKNFDNGPRILQEWNSPPVATMEFTYAGLPEGAQALQLKLSGVPTMLQPASHVSHGAQSVLINSTPLASCVGWVSSDVLVIGGGSVLQVWGGLQNFSQPHLLYSLVLESGPMQSFIVLPRSGVPKVRFAAVAAVHADGRVRLHSLPVPGPTDPQPLLIRQLHASPITPASASTIQSIAVSTHPSHPNRIILGHSDGSLRWIDLPSNPGAELPAPQGNGGAGFSIASAGYLPTSDAAFWAVGESASVAIGDIREPFGGPVQPANANSESFLKTADSSVVFPALIAGGDGGHIWALPWAGEQTPPPRLLCSLNGAALNIKCHPFLPLAMTGCASGAARALWLPILAATQKGQHQLVVHATSLEERSIVVDSPNDLNDNGFRSSGPLACCSVAWAPDLDGRYAVAHVGGLVRVGTVREFVLRSATK